MVRFITLLCIALAAPLMSNAQIYPLDVQGVMCRVGPGTLSIERTYDCALDGGPALDMGTFTDINPAGNTLTSLELVVYGFCPGDVTFFLNGTTIHMDSAPVGLTCTLCEPVASNSLNPQNYTVSVTPTVQAAFVAGGANTLSVLATNSANGSQCFYGVDVIVTTTSLNGPLVPTLSQWGLLLLALVLLCLGGIAISTGKWRAFRSDI